MDADESDVGPEASANCSHLPASAPDSTIENRSVKFHETGDRALPMRPQHPMAALHRHHSCSHMDAIADGEQTSSTLVHGTPTVLDPEVGEEPTLQHTQSEPCFLHYKVDIMAADEMGEGSRSSDLDPLPDTLTTPALIRPAFGIPPNPDTCPTDMHPDAFLKEMIRVYLGESPKVVSALSLPSPGFFPPITDEDLAGYTTEVVAGVRENDLDKIRDHNKRGLSLACCNRFGESLIHMACRRGQDDMVAFFLNEGGVSVRIRDDCGRTPLHDACWHRECQFGIVDTIIRLEPSLLFISDMRGHTPFAYARREHWGVWRKFISDRAELIVAGCALKEVLNLFGNAAASQNVAS